MIAVAPRILAVAAVASVGLIGLVVEESRARAAGSEVILAMEAVDPRALLSGHYVTVALSDTLPTGQACPPGTDAALPAITFPPSRSKAGMVWIALAPRGDRHAVAGAARDRAAAARLGPVIARGTVSCVSGQGTAAEQPQSPGAVTLDLGVDRFYASQDEARRIDALLANRKPGQDSPVSAILSIGKDGKARLKGLKVEGRRLDLSLL